MNMSAKAAPEVAGVSEQRHCGRGEKWRRKEVYVGVCAWVCRRVVLRY